jgi:hypothetical protein
MKEVRAMMDFSGTELNTLAVISERRREAEAAYRVAQFRQPPRGIRATLATRLAHMAVHLDRETARTLVVRHFGAAGRHS